MQANYGGFPINDRETSQFTANHYGSFKIVFHKPIRTGSSNLRRKAREKRTLGFNSASDWTRKEYVYRKTSITRRALVFGWAYFTGREGYYRNGFSLFFSTILSD